MVDSDDYKALENRVEELKSTNKDLKQTIFQALCDLFPNGVSLEERKTKADIVAIMDRHGFHMPKPEKTVYHSDVARPSNKRRSCAAGSSVEKKPEKKKRKKTVITYKGPEVPPDLPEKYKRKIKEMGGSEIELVIQKPLYETDVNSHHGRISISLKQVEGKGFLTQEEEATLQKQIEDKNKNIIKCIPGMKVGVIDTMLEDGEITLKRWDFQKKGGKISPQYILTTTWNRFVVKNNLKATNIVQIWCFRVDLKLHLAIVVVEQEIDSSNGTTTLEIGSSSDT